MLKLSKKRAVLSTLLAAAIITPAAVWGANQISVANDTHADSETTTITFNDVNMCSAIVSALGSTYTITDNCSDDTPTVTMRDDDIAAVTKLGLIDTENEPILNIEGLDNFTNLTELNLNFSPKREGNYYISDISVLSSLTDLESLTIRDSEISDLTPLSNLTNLKYLELYNALYMPNTYNCDISPLSNLTNLSSLDLSANYCIYDIQPLTNLSNSLEKLRFTENSKVSDFFPLSSLYNLKHLDISYNTATDLSVVASLRNLEFLDASCPSTLGTKDISALSNLSRNLKFLNLTDCKQIEGFASLSDLTNLTDLGLNGTNITNLEFLTPLNSLEHLILEKNQIYDISPLSKLINLVSVGLYDNKVSDLSPLSHLPNLKSVTLGKNKIYDISDISARDISFGAYLDGNRYGGAWGYSIISGNDLRNQIAEVTTINQAYSLPSLYRAVNGTLEDESAADWVANLAGTITLENATMNADGQSIMITDISEPAVLTVHGGFANGSTLTVTYVEPKETTVVPNTASVPSTTSVPETGEITKDGDSGDAGMISYILPAALIIIVTAGLHYHNVRKSHRKFEY